MGRSRFGLDFLLLLVLAVTARADSELPSSGEEHFEKTLTFPQVVYQFDGPLELEIIKKIVLDWTSPPLSITGLLGVPQISQYFQNLHEGNDGMENLSSEEHANSRSGDHYFLPQGVMNQYQGGQHGIVGSSQPYYPAGVNGRQPSYYPSGWGINNYVHQAFGRRGGSGTGGVSGKVGFLNGLVELSGAIGGSSSSSRRMMEHPSDLSSDEAYNGQRTLRGGSGSGGLSGKVGFLNGLVELSGAIGGGSTSSRRMMRHAADLYSDELMTGSRSGSGSGVGGLGGKGGLLNGLIDISGAIGGGSGSGSRAISDYYMGSRSGSGSGGLGGKFGLLNGLFEASGAIGGNSGSGSRAVSDYYMGSRSGSGSGSGGLGGNIGLLNGLIGASGSIGGSSGSGSRAVSDYYMGSRSGSGSGGLGISLHS